MEIYTVEKSLKTISLKAKTLLVIYGLLKMCTYAFLLSIVIFVIDFYIPDIPKYVRLFMFLISLGILVFHANRYIIKTILWKPTSSFLAGVAEAYFKDFNDTLISAVDFAKKVAKGVKNESQAMMVEVIKLAIKNIKNRPLSKVVNIKPLLRAYMYGITCIILSAYTISTFPEYVNIWFNRLIGKSVDWPKKTILVLVDPKTKPNTNIVSVGIGDKLKIVAQAEGVPVSKVLLYTRHYDNNNQVKEEYFYMNRLLAEENKNRFIYELVNITKSFEFYFKSQDIVSDIYKVETFPYPQIERIVYKITPPTYSNKAETIESNINTIHAQIGSNIEITIKANVPLWSGIIEFESLPENDFGKKTYLYSQIDPHIISGNFLAKKSSDFSITLNSRDDRNNKDPYIFSLNVSDDLPPLVKITYPEKSLKYITPVGKLPIWLEASDEYGIKHISMLLRKIEGNNTYNIIKTVKTKKNVTKLKKKIVIKGRKLKERLKAIEEDIVEINFSVWDNCKLEDAILNKEKRCPQKVTTDTKRIQIISAAEFEKRIDEIIADLKEKIIKTKEKQEYISNEIIKIKDTIPHGLIYEFIFKEQDVIETTTKVRNELYEVYSDIVNNKLYSGYTNTIQKNLQDAYKILSYMVGVRGEVNKGLLYDILRDINVINEYRKVRDVKKNIDYSSSLYDLILELLKEWEGFQELIRDARSIKEGVYESQKKLKELKK